jgi:hypothetical protein
MKVFLRPLQNGDIISHEDCVRMFSNVEMIVNFNSNELLKRMEGRVNEWGEEQVIGDIFLELVGLTYLSFDDIRFHFSRCTGRMFAPMLVQ